MIDKLINRQCTGCTACKNSCPQNVITMKRDKEGFTYPYVDEEKCLNCKICLQKCPILTDAENDNYSIPNVYAAWNLDSVIRENSTSGGIFTALATEMIKRGGYVAGAVYDQNFSIKHIVTNDLSDIERLRQSKYAQSELNELFTEIKVLLKKGLMVLFCGTPCQCAGLYNYVGRKKDLLYCCDFICRGVASPKVYEKFLNDMMQLNGSRLLKVHFKNKDLGWNKFTTKLVFDNNQNYQKDRNQDYYMRGFLKYNLYLRPSCYECKYKTLPRIADLSLGDFWGVGNYKKELDTDKGTSVILVNSDKGKDMLEWIKNDIYMEERSLQEVSNGNVCLLNSVSDGEFREFFFDNIDKYNFKRLIEKIDKKAMNLPVKERIFNKMHIVKLSILRKMSWKK